MVTEKSTPANAELLAVVCFELMVASVSRPMTAEGLTTNTLPFPLFVFIATLVLPMHDADAVPEQMPVLGQKPLRSQTPPVEHVEPNVQATAPWQAHGKIGEGENAAKVRMEGRNDRSRGNQRGLSSSRSEWSALRHGCDFNCEATRAASSGVGGCTMISPTIESTSCDMQK
jgi:hypothetical protein